MPLPPPPETAWTQLLTELLWLVLAATGGIAKYIDSYLKTGVVPRVGLLVGHAVVSGFSGYMVAQVALRTAPDWALVAAGVGGYLGTQGLDWLSTVLKKRLDPGDK